MTTVVTIPTLHSDQVRAFRVYRKNRFLALRAGRRWGKTEFCMTLICDAAVKGRSVGFFAPTYKILSESFYQIGQILRPVKLASSLTDGVYRTRTGGRVDLWSLENEDAGRSRKYHLAVVDEAAFAKNSTMMNTWQRAIKPTLLDYTGKAIVASNTNGVDPENFMWGVCNTPDLGFAQFHAPTRNNPYLPTEEVERLKATNHPLVYRQEYEAEFVDWSGAAFFQLDKMLVDGCALPYPTICDTVYAVIDTAIKAGSNNDGTGVTYFATSEHYGTRLMILDYDLVQMEGDSLRDWLPSVFERLEQLSRECNARMGVAGAWIEDQNSGSILLQHARKQDWNVHAIDTDLVAKGKDGRAISVSGYVYQELVKLSRYAYDKVIQFKGVSRNHLVSQVVGLRVGDKDAAKRSDDLLDTYTYGISLSLGNKDGW